MITINVVYMFEYKKRKIKKQYTNIISHMCNPHRKNTEQLKKEQEKDLQLGYMKLLTEKYNNNIMKEDDLDVK